MAAAVSQRQSLLAFYFLLQIVLRHKKSLAFVNVRFGLPDRAKFYPKSKAQSCDTFDVIPVTSGMFS